MLIRNKFTLPCTTNCVVVFYYVCADVLINMAEE